MAWLFLKRFETAHLQGEWAAAGASMTCRPLSLSATFQRKTLHSTIHITDARHAIENIDWKKVKVSITTNKLCYICTHIGRRGETSCRVSFFFGSMHKNQRILSSTRASPRCRFSNNCILRNCVIIIKKYLSPPFLVE